MVSHSLGSTFNRAVATRTGSFAPAVLDDFFRFYPGGGQELLHGEGLRPRQLGEASTLLCSDLV